MLHYSVRVLTVQNMCDYTGKGKVLKTCKLKFVMSQVKDEVAVDVVML